MGPLYTSQMAEGQLRKNGIAFGNPHGYGFPLRRISRLMLSFANHTGLAISA
jgi:hypothetical protein